MSSEWHMIAKRGVWLLCVEAFDTRKLHPIKHFDHYPSEEEVEAALAMSRTLTRD